MISYRATLDVPTETLTRFTRWLRAHRRRLGTRKGARTASCRQQAIMVLRWFRDDTPMRILAHDAGLPISTAYRYLHEGIAVLAEQAPELHDVLDRGRAEGWSHVNLDGTLIETTASPPRSPTPTPTCGTPANTPSTAATFRS